MSKVMRLIMYVIIAFEHIILRTYGCITFILEFLKRLLIWFDNRSMADAPFAAVCSWRAILFISHTIFPTDNEKPVFDKCPGDQDVTTDIGYPTAVVNWTQPTATDNSGIQTLTSTHNSGENFTIGNNTVTYTATDDAGNTEICTFFVIVSGKCLLMLYLQWNSFLSFSES